MSHPDLRLSLSEAPASPAAYPSNSPRSTGMVNRSPCGSVDNEVTTITGMTPVPRRARKLRSRSITPTRATGSSLSLAAPMSARPDLGKERYDLVQHAADAMTRDNDLIKESGHARTTTGYNRSRRDAHEEQHRRRHSPETVKQTPKRVTMKSPVYQNEAEVFEGPPIVPPRPSRSKGSRPPLAPKPLKPQLTENGYETVKHPSNNPSGPGSVASLDSGMQDENDHDRSQKHEETGS